MMATFGGDLTCPHRRDADGGRDDGQASTSSARHLVAVTIAWFIVGRSRRQQSTAPSCARGTIRPPSRLRFGLPLLPYAQGLRRCQPSEGDVSRDRTPCPPKALRVLATRRQLTGRPRSSDARGSYLGTVGTERLEEVANVRPRGRARDAIDTTTGDRARVCHPRRPVWRPWSKQVGAGCPSPAATGRVVGVLSAEDLLGGLSQGSGPPYTGYVYNVSSHALACGRTAVAAALPVRRSPGPPTPACPRGAWVVTVAAQRRASAYADRGRPRSAKATQ